MKFALFLGCNIPVRVPQYELAARAVLDHLGIGVEDAPLFKCCGNPMRNTDYQTYVLMAARNLAVAEARALDILVLCMCCFGSLKKAAQLLARHPDLTASVNKALAKEGLRYTGAFGIKHFLSVLYHDTGIPVIREKVSRPFKGLKIAAHYGCHGLRPSDVTQFDNPVAPVVLDELVAATGARSVDWPLKLDCCGAPLLGVQDRLSWDLTEKKLADARRSGADFLCVACPYCQMQFDQVQAMMKSPHPSLPSLVYPQLLGVSMGLDGAALGMDRHVIDIKSIESFLE